MVIIEIDNPNKLPVGVNLMVLTDPPKDAEIVYAMTHKALKYVEYFVPQESEEK